MLCVTSVYFSPFDRHHGVCLVSHVIQDNGILNPQTRASEQAKWHKQTSFLVKFHGEKTQWGDRRMSYDIQEKKGCILKTKLGVQFKILILSRHEIPTHWAHSAFYAVSGISNEATQPSKLLPHMETKHMQAKTSSLWGILKVKSCYTWYSCYVVVVTMLRGLR